MGTCFVRTLDFSHDLHAAHDTNNALFKTSVWRVFDFLDNRLSQLFKQFGFRNHRVQGFFFWRKTHTHSEIKATARSGYFKPTRLQERTREGRAVFLVSSSNCLRTMMINYIYVTGYLIFLRMAVTNFRTALIPGGGLVQLLIPARQCNCPHPAGIPISKSLFVDSFPMIPRGYIMDTLWVSWVVFKIKNCMKFCQNLKL